MTTRRAVVRLGDICTGHGCFSPRPNIEASKTVSLNSLPMHRVGDKWAPHCCVSCHGGVAAQGSPNVIIEGRAVCRTGDAISCGSKMATGSSNVFIN